MVRDTESGLLVDESEVPIPDRRAIELSVLRRPMVTVIGQGFYDIDHSGKNSTRNRRNYDSSLAVWEIHPVIKLIQRQP